MKDTHSSMKDTQILMLNWNGGHDTAASVDAALSFPDASVSILDNHSTDNSLDLVKAVAQQHSIIPHELQLRNIEALSDSSASLNIIVSDKNLGFAKGINTLLKQICKNRSVKYIWLLNNDAIPDKNALSALKQAIEKEVTIAFAGSVIFDFYDRTKIQACGVDYYKFFGVGKLLLKDEKWPDITPQQLSHLKPVFQHGASLLIKTSHLNNIGYMDEQFFLYAEEHDWQVNAEEKGYKNILATESFVYHKGSVSTIEKKHLFYYHYNTSSIYFSRKHYNIFVNITATIMLAGITMIRARFNPKATLWGLKGIIEGWSKNIPAI